MFNRSGKLDIAISVLPVILLEPVAIEKMKAYVTLCDKEIGWLGTATQSGNTVTIHDMFLFEQEAHATTCEINEQAVAKWYEDVLNTHENGVEIVNTMRVWGHSHVNMGIGASGQDDVQFKELSKNVNDFFIRIIANKKGDMQLDYYDAKTGLIFHNIEWQYIVSIDLDAIKNEIKEKVKVKTYTQYNTKPYNTKPYSPTPSNVTPYYNKQQALDAYDWYDEYYGNYGTGTGLEKDNIVTTWVDVLSAEELMEDFAFTEDDIVNISELLTATGVKAYMAEEKIDETVTDEEARHLLAITTNYVNAYYGRL